MSRDRYVAMGWVNGEVSGAGTTLLIRTKLGLESEGWRLVHERPGLWVFGVGDDAVPVVPLGAYGGVVLGDVFGRDGDVLRGPLAPAGEYADATHLCRWLSRAVWGRYVAIVPDAPADRWSVFRDPLGGLNALVWRLHDVSIAASELPDAVITHATKDLSIDWSKLCAVAADPPSADTRSLLSGLGVVSPGEVVHLASGSTSRVAVWTPQQIACSAAPGADIEARLREVVDRCVGAWARAYSPVIAEISGGLDSAIVSTTLARHDVEVRGWFNHYIAAWVGDERPFAREVAKQAGVTLTEVARPPFNVAIQDLVETADQPWPTFNASDVGFDRAMTQAARSAEARAILTGQGGDVVFFQMQTPLVAADRFAARGFAGLSLGFLREIAESNQTSVWRVLRDAVGLGRKAPPRSRAYLTTRAHREAARQALAPWRRVSRGMPPAKALQVAHLAYIQVVRGRSRRGRVAAVIHPLLSQPVVELCLAIPSDMLVKGGRPRGLARDAFADQLPVAVARRRTKGDMTAFYGHAIADRLCEIRSFLLDGRLVSEGVVHRDVLSEVLTLENLAHAGSYGEVFELLAIEAWVRSWEERLIALSAPDAAGGPISGERKANTSAQ